MCGTIIHFFLLISIFDLHLQREVDQGLPQNCMNSPLAKRLVLIIINGLDGEKTLNLVKFCPFMRGKVQPHIWGIAKKNNLIKSNGITAITGGFEQNTRPFSSIYKQENSRFDQIFNYANETVYIGELKNLQYFGDISKHWIKIIINNNDSNNNTYLKDVIDRFEQDNQIGRDNSIFRGNNTIFLCLLPVTAISNKNYEARIKFEKQSITHLFENKVYKLIQTINRFYDDHDTAFILCSDNGVITNNEKHN